MVLRIKFVLLEVPSWQFWFVPVILLLLLKWKSRNITKHLMSGPLGNQLVLFSWESWCFPWLRLGKHQDSRENKTNCFPRDLTLSVYYTMLSKYDMVCLKIKTSWKWVVGKNSLYFVGVFCNKTIIPLALVGYEMIITNSYPMRTCVKYWIQWVDYMYNSESPPWDLNYQ